MPLTIAYVALGSNLGDRMSNLRSALRMLELGGDLIVLQVSSAYENRAIGMGEAEPFLNAVAELSTSLSAEALLQRGLEVEDRLGRVRSGVWAPRTMDIDLLLYGASKVETQHLQLPHPRILERDFVLCPLLQIAPQLVLNGRALSEWVAALSELELSQVEERIWAQPQVRMIAAVAANRVIGRDGKLPWSIPEDWALFLRKTRGGTLLMGRKSFLEMTREPNWAEQRDYIVITSQPEKLQNYGVRTTGTVAEAVALGGQAARPIWVCGGEAVYAEALPLADQLHLTLVHAEVAGDTCFPDWTDTFTAEIACAASRDSNYHYSFKILER
ncbi:MAG: 2-amino-4-hydroxy-6-hydroxymethyldihydropteridine diphosphokinase [Lentimonas sp.]|jgi:2-amino-4-hydroxy-6-hydroxymethyldihydropteridine diphosphokinase